MLGTRPFPAFPIIFKKYVPDPSSVPCHLRSLLATLETMKLWSLTSIIYFAGVYFFCLRFLKFNWTGFSKNASKTLFNKYNGIQWQDSINNKKSKRIYNYRYSRLYRWRAALKPVPHFTSATYKLRKTIINKWNFIFLKTLSERVESDLKSIFVERPDILACTVQVVPL